MKTPDEIKDELLKEFNEDRDMTSFILINKAFSLGVEEGKKQNITKIKPMDDYSKAVYNKACEDIKKKIITRICMNCEHERCITLRRLFSDITHELQEEQQ